MAFVSASGGGDRGRRAGRKRLQQPLMLAGEIALLEVIERHQDAKGLIAKHQRDDLPEQPGGQLAGAGREVEPVTVYELDDQHARRHERATALSDQLENRLQIGLTPERPRDLDRRVQRLIGLLQLPALGFGARVALGVVNRQIEVSVGLAFDHDRHPEKRAHRRMTDREPIGVGMAAHVADAQRTGIADQLAEYPRPVGSGPIVLRVSSSMPSVKNRLR